MLWLLCALSDTQRRRAFAACAGSECRGSRAGAAHNGHGFLASVWLFPTWVSQHASLLKPSVVRAWSGRCAVMRGPRKQGWWLQSSVWRIFQISVWKMNMWSDQGWRAGFCSFLLPFYDSVFWLFKIRSAMCANSQGMEWASCQQHVGM